MKTVSIEPLGPGWAVRSPSIDNDLIFLSGAKAEQAAMDLSLALAADGDSVELRVRLRDGGSTARFVCPIADNKPIVTGPAWRTEAA